jgi:hypothetical protein
MREEGGGRLRGYHTPIIISVYRSAGKPRVTVVVVAITMGKVIERVSWMSRVRSNIGNIRDRCCL